MDRVQDQAPDPTKEEKEWIAKNLAEQELRHAEIIAEMERITADRDAWIDSFHERIQTRGFNYNCDELRQIPEEEIPEKPKRRFKVVF